MFGCASNLNVWEAELVSGKTKQMQKYKFDMIRGEFVIEMDEFGFNHMIWLRVYDLESKENVWISFPIGKWRI